MSPPPAATATATRRQSSAAHGAAAPRRTGRGAEAPATRRAPLQIVPARTRRGIRGGRTGAARGRLLTVISISMVVFALLAVVVGQAFLANGQVKLAGLQHELAMEQATHRQAELAVSALETPTRIVAAATKQGMVNGTVTELPYVSLSAPLPTPKVTPAPAPPAPTTSTASAGAPAGGTASRSTSSTTATTTPTTATTTATTTP